MQNECTVLLTISSLFAVLKSAFIGIRFSESESVKF